MSSTYDESQSPTIRSLTDESRRNLEKAMGSAFTFGSTVMVASERPELHVTPGPPHEHEYTVIGFS